MSIKTFSNYLTQEQNSFVSGVQKNCKQKDLLLTTSLAILDLISSLKTKEIQLIDDLEKVESKSETDFYRKIQFFARIFTQYYKKPESKYFYRLSNLEIKVTNNQSIFLIQKLIENITSFAEPYEGNRDRYNKKIKAERSLYVLQLLSKCDPVLERIHTIASKAFLSQDRNLANQLLNWNQSCFRSLEVKFPIRNYPGPVSLQNTNLCLVSDLEASYWRISKIFLGAFPSVYSTNLSDIGQKENYLVESSLTRRENLFKWLRDLAVFNSKDELLLPYRITTNDIIIQMYSKFINAKNDKLMGQVAKLAPFLKMLIESGFKEASFYFEGGNLIPVQNQTGTNYYLSGSSNIIYTFLNDSYRYISEQLKTPTDISYSKSELDLMQGALEGTGVFSLFEIQNPVPIEEICIAAIKSLAQIQNNMEKELGSPIINIGSFFEAQPDFHIDMFLTPLPKGRILLQDFRKSVEILTSIKLTKQLSDFEMTRIDAYLKNSKLLMNEHQKSLDEIKQKLEENGFIVEPISGIYCASSYLLTVNFLNSIVGVENHETYIISNGSIHPVDRYLREEFMKSLDRIGIKRVYFTGRPSTGNISSQGALEFHAAHDSLKFSGGVHCRTIDVRNDKQSDQIQRAIEIINNTIN